MIRKSTLNLFMQSICFLLCFETEKELASVIGESVTTIIQDRERLRRRKGKLNRLKDWILEKKREREKGQQRCRWRENFGQSKRICTVM